MTKKTQEKPQPENELTTMKIPLEMKRFCKNNDIPYRRCFSVGYNFLIKGGADQTKENNREIEEMREDNVKIQRKLREIALKLADMGRKNEN